MQNASSTTPGVGGAQVLQNRCGHRRSSSLPVGSINTFQSQSVNGEGVVNGEHTHQNEAKKSENLIGLVDTFNQICDSLSRPTKNLLKLLDAKNKNVQNSNKGNENHVGDELCVDEQIQTVVRQLNTIQGNLKHVLPHMEGVLRDYKTMKERTQSRDEMLKTLDKALRRSEARSQALVNELQDLRDENKCLKEKALQNESILRYLDEGKEEPADEKGTKREKRRGIGGSVRIKRDTVRRGLKTKSQSMGNVSRLDKNGVGENVVDSPKIDPGVGDLVAKLGHHQKVLKDYENQLQEVVSLNKELVLKINDKEAEVMSVNRELLKHQETLSIYEKGFANLTKGNSEMDALLREERAKNIELREKLDDTEGYISCITDKVASYEVELQYLRQQLRGRNEKTT